MDAAKQPIYPKLNIGARDACWAENGEDPCVSEAKQLLHFVTHIESRSFTPPYDTRPSMDHTIHPLPDISEYDCDDGNMCFELVREHGLQFRDGHQHDATTPWTQATSCLTVMELGTGRGARLASGRYGHLLGSFYFSDQAVYAQLYDDDDQPRAFLEVPVSQEHLDALSILRIQLDRLSEVAPVEPVDTEECIETMEADVQSGTQSSETPRGYFFVPRPDNLRV